jgi:hypothetical protein
MPPAVDQELGPIDILFKRFAPLTDATAELFDVVFAANTKGQSSPRHPGSPALRVNDSLDPQSVGLDRLSILPALAGFTISAEEPISLTHICTQAWQSEA